MKGILNVLYRRILYKIPLKFLLLLLAIGAVLFASVNADVYLMQGGNANDITNYNGDIYLDLGNNISYSIDDSWGDDLIYNFTASCPSCPSCPSTGDILSGYILESDIDPYYCENNNLCPVYTGECENSSGVNWSSLYINNIQHIGGPNIYIDIPEELSRDYDYTDEDMYIDIEGYNVDYDKITGIINTQNYKPTNEDFNYIVSSIIPLFVPGLVIILFLYWIFRFIKKIF